MASIVWVLVEWVDRKNVYPCYGVVKVNPLDYDEKDLYPGNLITMSLEYDSPQRAKIRMISKYRSHVMEEKEVMESHDRKFRNALKMCMRSLNADNSLNTPTRPSDRSPLSQVVVAKNASDSDPEHTCTATRSKMRNSRKSTLRYNPYNRKESIGKQEHGPIIENKSRRLSFTSSTPLSKKKKSSAQETPTIFFDQGSQTESTYFTINAIKIGEIEANFRRLHSHVTTLLALSKRHPLPNSEAVNKDLHLAADVTDSCIKCQPSKSVRLTSESVVETPESVVETPESVVETPESVVETPESVEKSPESVVETPESVVETPESVVETPESVIETPESVVETPKSVVETLESVVETPEAVVETPESVVKTPESVEVSPEPKTESGAVRQKMKRTAVKTEKKLNLNHNTSRVHKVSTETSNNIGIMINDDLVPIGKGHARVPPRLLKDIDWNSHTSATRQLLQALFSRKVLATHSLTGKKSPAFLDRPAKEILNPLIIEDIVTTVSARSNVSRSLVRNCITIKCTDEAKLYRNRLQNKQARMQQVLSNRENIAPPKCSTNES